MILVRRGIANVTILPPSARAPDTTVAIGTAGTLRDAYDEGYRIGCFTASQLGWPIYTKLGLKNCTDYHTYRWPPP
jgi:hypothetical protein